MVVRARPMNVSCLFSGVILNAGFASFFPRDTQSLPSLPQAFATDAELLCQLGFAHGVLMFEYEALEVILQR